MEETAKSQTSAPTNTQAASPPKRKWNKKLIISYIVIVVVFIAAIVGIYLWQRGVVKGLETDKSSLKEKVASQSAQLKKLQKENKDLKSKVSFLEKSLIEATASANFELGELTISVSKTVRYDDPGNLADDDTPAVLVDLNVKNETEQTLFLSTLSFKLKDKKNRTYLPDTSLPGTRVSLKDQQVVAGESVVGSIAFYSVPKSESLFTLFYDTQQFTITVK